MTVGGVNSIYTVQLRQLEHGKLEEKLARSERSDAHRESEASLHRNSKLEHEAGDKRKQAKDIENGLAWAAGIGIGAILGTLSGKLIGWISAGGLRDEQKSLEAAANRSDLELEQSAGERDRTGAVIEDARERVDRTRQFAAEIRGHQAKLTRRIT